MLCVRAGNTTGNALTGISMGTSRSLGKLVAFSLSFVGTSVSPRGAGSSLPPHAWGDEPFDVAVSNKPARCAISLCVVCGCWAFCLPTLLCPIAAVFVFAGLLKIRPAFLLRRWTRAAVA